MAIDSNTNIHERLAAAEAALHAVGQQISPAIRHIDIAVLVPAFNEAATIGEVVRSFRVALPHAKIYVYDNNSWDNTSTVAREAGAIVRREPLQGKGHVVRRMFSDVEADVYVMVDGDATYDAASAPRMVSRLIETQADMVVGARITEEKAAYRAGHRLGNRVLTGLVAKLFGDRFTDMLSGYRVFSRRFVKSFPALAGGFEIENSDLTQGAGLADLSWLRVDTAQHIEARTDQFVAAFRYVNDYKKFTTAYMVRAVSPGTFVLPGATVEDMYRPELRANTDAGRIEITAAGR